MHRIRQPLRILRRTRRRSGFTTPAVAVALLVVMMGLAMILDRIWLETAKLELKTASEAAALAAARELASDNLLLANAAVSLRMNNALQAAGWIAENNYVAGLPLTLDLESDGDVRFGNLAVVSNQIQFEESTDNPTTVVVTGLRTRANNNPVALFVAGATGLHFGDVAARAEATIDNTVIGVRPFDGSPIPAFPLAILMSDPTGVRLDTWNNLIEASQGADAFGYDDQSHVVVPVADGIPEITLHSLAVGNTSRLPNLQLLDLGTKLNDTELNRQFTSGISENDLLNFDGILWIGNGSTFNTTATPTLQTTDYTSLQKLIGERRICFLYSTVVAQNQPSLVTTSCVGVVAIRVMSATNNTDGSYDFVVQPTVLTTRTAVLASECVTAPTTNSATANSDTSTGANIDPNANSNLVTTTGTYTIANFGMPSYTGTVATTTPNRYLYKMRLTH